LFSNILAWFIVSLDEFLARKINQPHFEKHMTDWLSLSAYYATANNIQNKGIFLCWSEVYLYSIYVCSIYSFSMHRCV